MLRRFAKTFAVLVVVTMALAACGTAGPKTAKTESVTVEQIEGSAFKKLTLTAHAAQRLGISTIAVAAAPGGSGGQSAVPYSAIIYDAKGATWTYTNPEGLVFIREQVTVEKVADDLAILDSGPADGMLVVTVGAPELWGVETGVGGGH
jgi:hypothetical protein